MRTLTLLSLLTLTTACEDRQVEVHEAPAEDGSAVVSEGRAPDTSEEDAPAPGVEGSEATTEAAEPKAQLLVEILEQGEGPALHRGMTVRVHYEAWLAEAHAGDGAPFDSSLSRLVPLELRLGGTGAGVIEGLTRGLLGLRVGSRARLLIPAELGWGATGNPAAGVAPDSDLVYEVRVLSVR